jgi:hypothetical protein
LKQLLTVMEPVLLVATLQVMTRSRRHVRLPMFSMYLLSRVAVCLPLLVLLYGVRLHLLEPHGAYAVYYYWYWTGYLVGSVFALLAVHEVFSRLMKPFPSLSRYALIAFRWVAFISMLVSLAVAIYPAKTGNILVTATSAVMRSVSVLVLCLLAFILVSMQTLRLSARSREFGVVLGLGIISFADLFGSTFAFRYPTFASIAAIASQAVVTLGVGTWMVYFLMREPQLEQVQESPASLERWNEIAGALTAGAAPQVSLASQGGTFFLQDVEKAVDRVLERNSVNPGP